MHAKIALVALGLALAAAGPTLGQRAPADEEWQKIVIKGQTYYRMPDAVMRGLGFEVADLPDDQNAAIALLRALDSFGDFEGDWELMDQLTKAPWTQREFPEVAAWLKANKAAFDLVDQALALDDCRFPILMAKPGVRLLFGSMMPHLSGLRAMARGLVARAHLHEGEGRPAEAIDDCLRLVRLARHAGRGDNLISGLVGIALDHMAFRAIRGLLERRAVPPKLVGDLQATLVAAREWLPDPVHAMGSERVSGVNAVDHFMRGGARDVLQMMAMEEEPVAGPGGAFWGGACGGSSCPIARCGPTSCASTIA